MKETTLIKSGVTLSGLYEHLYNIYTIELKEHGLIGVYRYRNRILEEIRSLSPLMFKIRNRTLDETTFKESFRYLNIFKEILLK